MGDLKILTCEGWFYAYVNGVLAEYGDDLERFLIRTFGVDVDPDTAYDWEDPDNPPATLA